MVTLALALGLALALALALHAHPRPRPHAGTCFFYAPSAGGPTGQIRKLTKLGEPKTGVPQLVLLDIPDSGGFYVSDATEVSADTVSAFLDAYKAGALERKQLS